MSFERDMRSYRGEVTMAVSVAINRDPQLYKEMKKATSVSNLTELAVNWAERHGNELGNVSQLEFDMVDWSKVYERL